MKKVVVIIIIILIAAAGVFWYLKNHSPKTAPAPEPIINQTPMTITSLAFAQGQAIPVKYTCDGEGVNPPLDFASVPAGAVSLVLIVDDPDAPVGTWTHWTIWNIAPTTVSVAENSVPPKAIQGQTSSGQNVYGGPCPPSGQHRYYFKLYALDIKLNLSSFSTVDKLTEAMQDHIIGQAELMGVYSRNK